MLPMNSGSEGLPSGSVGPRLPEYFRRMVILNQMDFDLALAQMMYLIISPERAFREAKNRKLTKNHWARDDPAFLVLVVRQILLICTSYFLCIGVPLGLPFTSFLKLVAYQIGVNFLALGLILSTLFWFIINKYLHGKGQMHEVRQPMEWQYAFDVHCNAYFTMIMMCGVTQIFLLPWLLSETFLARVLANAIYSLSFSKYFYVTFRGYVELPFLESQEYFLYPVFFIALWFVLTLVTTFNMTSWVINGWIASA
eukprot:TRINITY_DN5600_c6_g1_i1.p1 TRINITY_DN5600_c6_g1~~TRINITY_DN5600_c6_g1_i1.p1  ORF type:complete len:294 (+),score=20.25 TRINITY_DN5600_c6_g1_i1:122-883(+)